MKISMNLHDDHQYSIMQRVLDGTLAVDSVEEFREILRIYPEDPLLQRKYADLLMHKSLLDEAQAAFQKACGLFIEEQMNLQAIVAKILQWSIQKPNHEAGQQFHKLLSQKGARHTPLQRFWSNMTYGELVALMLRLVREKLSTGQKIACVDEPANDIYFVVSGTLAETISPDCQFEASKAGLDTEPMLLGPNDIIGNIFPLDQPTRSYTDVVAVNEVELVKIAKPVLFDTCRKYPNIETLLRDIYKPENVDKCDHAWQTVRRSARFGVPTKVEITAPAKEGGDALNHLTGIAVDLSLGGVCVDLGSAIQASTDEIGQGRPVELTLDLLNEIATVRLTGKIVWQRHQKSEDEPSTLIGIRFDAMDATDRELLTEYCSGSVGEQNLLWSLWDSLVKPDNA
jgi:CRP-like cAMP-binding protein